MKRYWKLLVLVLIIIVAIVGVFLYRRDSHGKPFKARLASEKIMMTPDWYANVRLTANDGATYEVKNSKGKVIQGKTSTKDGKADIKLNNTGKYTIIAKSDNGHVSKKLPVKVTNYKKNFNKTTTKVSPLSFKIGNVEYKKMKKSKDNSYNMESYSQLNNYYYQVTINYEVYNHGKKPVNPQYTTWTPVTDNNKEFEVNSSSVNGYAMDNIIGTNAIGPNVSRNGTMTLISNDKFSVQHLKFTIEDVRTNNGVKIADGGTAKLN